MDRWELEKLSGDLLAGRLSQAEFVAAIAAPKSAELGDVTLDLDRQRRCGYPEVIFGQSKSVETLAAILRRLLDAGQPVLATRVEAEKGQWLVREFPSGRYNAVARTFRIDVGPICRMGPRASPSSRLGRVTFRSPRRFARRPTGWGRRLT
jgi:hypothetical protein